MALPNFTVVIRSYEWVPWVVTDVIDSLIQFSTTENGYDRMILVFKRPPDDYLELNFNMGVQLKNPDGDSIWEGYLEARNETYEAALGKLSWDCFGYWVATADTMFAATSTTVAPETFIKNTVMARVTVGGNQPMTNLPRLLYSFDQIYTTGLTITIATPDNGLTKINTQAAILQACAAGDSAGQKVVPFVWENRILGTKPIPKNPTAKYVVETLRFVRYSAKQAMSDVYNTIQTKFINSTGGAIAYANVINPNPLLPYWANDYVDDVVAGSNLQYSNYRKDKELDITKYGAMTSTAAAYYGTATLNDGIEVKPVGSFTLLSECRIWDAGEGVYRKPYELRAGEFIQIPRTRVRPSPGWDVYNGNDKRLMYISRTEYRAGDVTITPARSTDLVKLLK